jgi:hypothetical protein
MKAVGFLIPASVFIVAQGLDWHSTKAARDSGHGIEGNPWMNVSTSQQIAIKAAVTGSVIYLTAKLSTHHQTAARVMLYGLSGVLAGVIVNNYAIAAGQR